MSNSTNQTWIPPTTSQTVVFPFESGTFQKDFYEPELTGGQVSIEEVDQFLNDIETEFKSSEMNPATGCLVCIMMISFFTDFILTFIWASSDREFFELFTNGEAIALAWIVPFVIFFIFKLCDVQTSEDYSSNQRKWIYRDIVEKYNDTLESKGFKWYLPNQFPAWIELTKNMEKKNNETDDFERVGLHRVPTTTEFRIIFPGKRFKLSSIYQFNQDLYSPDMVDGRVSSQEMRAFLAQINDSFRTPIEGSYKITYSVLIWLCIELYVLCYIDNHLPNLLTTLPLVIIAVISVILGIILMIIESNSEDKRIKMQIKSGCQDILDRQNVILHGRGLRWRLPKEFPSWIELCKDDTNQDFSQQSEIEPEDDIEEVSQFSNESETEFNPSKTNSTGYYWVICTRLWCQFSILATILIMYSEDSQFKPYSRDAAYIFAWVIPFAIFFFVNICAGKILGPEEGQDDSFAIANQYPIPPTTNFIIIFPAQQSKLSKIYRFTQDYYSPDMVDGRVSSQEMSEFLTQINDFLRRPKEEFFKIRSHLLNGLVFEFFVLSCLYIRCPGLLTILQIIIIAVISEIVCIILMIIESDRADKKRKQHIKNGCQEILDQQNRTLQGRGLRWRLPKGFPDWIELCKDDESNNFSSQQSESEPEERKQYSDQGYQKKMNNQMYLPLPQENEEDLL